MTVELLEFIGFPDKITSQLKTHTDEGKIKVKSFEVKGRARPFIDGDDVINRLNEAFSHAWSDEVVHSEQVGDEVIVQVRLSVMFPNGYTVSHHGYGSGTPKGREQILRGDLFKSAHTSAIKSAAKKFGIGLFMEESGFEDSKYPAKKPWTPKPEQPRPVAVSSPSIEPVVVKEEVALREDTFDPFADMVSAVSGNSTTKKAFSARPSDAQLNALHNMSRTLGVTNVEGQVELMSKALVESDLPDDEKETPQSFSELSKRQASVVISYCVNQMDSKKKRA